MQIDRTELEDVVVFTPRRFGDDRGYFCETWNAAAMAKAGFKLDFVQDNQSWSRDPGTVRGLHFQAPPAAQDKLVRVVTGTILDVAVDVRSGSPTYGKWVGVELSAENGRQLLIPKGFLHGFATLTSDCHVLYKCTDFYAPASEGSVRFDDPALGIDWGIDADKAILSEKDAAAPGFDEFKSPFQYEGAR